MLKRVPAVESTKGRYPVLAGSCPDDLPFSGEKFDLICFLDSLNIAADEAALVAARNLLAPGGKFLSPCQHIPGCGGAHDIFLHVLVALCFLFSLKVSASAPEMKPYLVFVTADSASSFSSFWMS